MLLCASVIFIISFLNFYLALVLVFKLIFQFVDKAKCH